MHEVNKYPSQMADCGDRNFPASLVDEMCAQDRSGPRLWVAQSGTTTIGADQRLKEPEKASRFHA